MNSIPTFQIPFNNEQPLNGIIKSLQTITEEQYLNNSGIISLTASSITTSFVPENIFLDQSNVTSGYWASSKEGNQWLQLNFHKNAVQVTDYSLFAYDWDFLKEWEIYCALNTKKWNKVDHENLNQQPSGKGKKISLSFHVDDPLICKYFRIVQKGPRWDGDSYFMLHKLELFGVFYNHSSLLKIVSTFHYCSSNNYLHKIAFFLFFLSL